MSDAAEGLHPEPGAQPPVPLQPAPGAVQVVQQRLKRIYRGLSEILDDIPSSLLELKRQVKQKLDFDPTPQQLQLLPQFARVGDGDARELCIRMLTVHLVLEQVLGEFSRTTRLDKVRIHGSLALLPVLQATSRTLEGEFQQRLDAISRLHRDEVVKLHTRLERPEVQLQAALVLGPELERLAEESRGVALSEAAPSLSEDEIALIVESSQRPVGYDEAVRARLDGVAMRTLIESDLQAWEQLSSPGEGETEISAERMQAFKKLELDKAAYRGTSHRLNEVRAGNFSGARAGAEEIRRTQQRLFGVYRTLNRVIHAGPMNTLSVSIEQDEQAAEEAAARLHDQVLEAERAGAEVDANRHAKRELVRNAVSGTETAEAKPDLPPSQRDLKRERKRRKLLIGIALTLVPISAVVNVLLYRGSSGGELPTPATFESAMPVRNVIPAMTILQAEVSTFLWDNMSEQERLTKVEDVARIAMQDGYTDVHLVNESQLEVARWSASRGVELLGTPTE